MGQTVGTPSGWKGRGNPWREERVGEKVRRKGRKRADVERWREASRRSLLSIGRRKRGERMMQDRRAAPVSKVFTILAKNKVQKAKV